MMLRGFEPERICVYFIYDRDGIVYDYIIEQVRALRRNVSIMLCVVNGDLTPESHRKLETVCDEVFIRENKGNDIGAYKAALEHLGWERISNYDEVILTNFTCFGPVYPYEEVFEWSRKQDVSIWGLTYDQKQQWQMEGDYLHHNNNPRFIQSYFLAFRRPLLGSRLLRDFFREIPEEVDYVNSGLVYELAFPGYFEERGYKYAVYCEQEQCDYEALHDPVHLMEKFRMPLFKRRSFYHHYSDVMNHSTGESTARLIRYLEENRLYNMNLVWDCVLRSCALGDVVRCAQLNRILPRDELSSGAGKSKLKVGLVYHAFYEELFDDSVVNISHFNPETDILVTTDTEGKKQKLKRLLKKADCKAVVKVVKNRGREMSALLVAASEFVFAHDLICFAHDKKMPQVNPYSVGRSWAYRLHENVLATREYVMNVIHLFEMEARLGIAFPSPPNHAGYAFSIGDGWQLNFDVTQRLLNDFGVYVKLQDHTLCVAPLGTCFWFRPMALKRLFSGYDGRGWSFEDFPREPIAPHQTLIHAIEHSCAYFAQAEGFYPAYIYNNKFAEIDMTTLEYYKAGSTHMREYTDALVMKSLGYDKVMQQNKAFMESLGLQPGQVQVMGIRQCLINLAASIRFKYPRFWKLMLPVRRTGQFILRIRTKP